MIGQKLLTVIALNMMYKCMFSMSRKMAKRTSDAIEEQHKKRRLNTPEMQQQHRYVTVKRNNRVKLITAQNDVQIVPNLKIFFSTKPMTEEVVISIPIPLQDKQTQTESNSVETSVQTRYNRVVQRVSRYFELRVQARDLAEQWHALPCSPVLISSDDDDDDTNDSNSFSDPGCVSTSHFSSPPASPDLEENMRSVCLSSPIQTSNNDRYD